VANFGLHRADDRDVGLDLPMSDALCIGMDAKDARHEVGKIPQVYKKLADLFGARPNLNVVAVTRLDREH
jgi:hypothetical protein